jgi:hypothetical protein
MSRTLNQEAVNDIAKLMMHRLIARMLARDPSLIDRARASLIAMASRYPERSFVRDWDELLRYPPKELRLMLASRDPKMTRLRLSSPFVTAEGLDFTAPAARRRIRRAAKRVAARAGSDSRQVQSASQGPLNAG